MSKAPELSVPPPLTQAPATSSGSSRPNAQYRYHSNAEDQRLLSELEDYLMQGKLSLTTPAHIFAVSPAIRRNVIEKLKVRRVKTNEYEVVPVEDAQTSPSAAWITTKHDDTSDCLSHQPSAFCFLLQDINVLVNSSLKAPAILDTSSQFNVIRHDIVQSLGACINYQRLVEMEGANGATNWTVGCAENLTLQVGDLSFKVNAHVVEDASFLLGRPFQRTALFWFEDLPTGEVEVSVCDPTNPAQRTYLTSCPRTGRVPAISILSVRDCATSSPPPQTGEPPRRSQQMQHLSLPIKVVQVTQPVSPNLVCAPPNLSDDASTCLTHKACHSLPLAGNLGDQRSIIDESTQEGRD